MDENLVVSVFKDQLLADCAEDAKSVVKHHGQMKRRQGHVQWEFIVTRNTPPRVGGA